MKDEEKKPKSRFAMDEAELWFELEASGVLMPSTEILRLRLLERLAVAVEDLAQAVRGIIDLGTAAVETAEARRRR